MYSYEHLLISTWYSYASKPSAYNATRTLLRLGLYRPSCLALQTRGLMPIEETENRLDSGLFLDGAICRSRRLVFETPSPVRPSGRRG